MSNITLDATDRTILDALLGDARISQRHLSELTGLTAPAVRDRVRRLEQQVINAFTIDISAQAMGYTLEAIVRLEPLPGKLHVVQRALEDCLQVVQCDKVTGEDCFVARMVLRDIGDLDDVLDPFHATARTNTAIVKSTPVSRRRPPF